jgi:hypothetical protein
MQKDIMQGLQIGLARQYDFFPSNVDSSPLIMLLLHLTELTCEQYQALPLDERAPEDIAFTELAKKQKWKRCPKVRSQVT